MSSHVLPGVTEKITIGLFENQGYAIESRKVTVDDLQASDRVLITNSLIGAQAVERLDDITFSECADIATELNKTLLDDQ